MYNKIFELYAKVLDDKELPLETKQELFNEIRKIMSPTDNRWNFLYVILALGLVALAVPAFAFAQLASDGKVDIPEALLSIAATAIGALAGLITRMSKSTVPEDTP